MGITRVGYDRILIVELKGSQWRTVTHNFQMKLFTQTLEITAKIHVYSYRGLTDVSQEKETFRHQNLQTV